MVTISMMSEKLTTSGILKIKIFRIKAYDIIILHYDVTNKVLSCDSIGMVDVAIFTKVWLTLEKLP